MIKKILENLLGLPPETKDDHLFVVVMKKDGASTVAGVYDREDIALQVASSRLRHSKEPQSCLVFKTRLNTGLLQLVYAIDEDWA